MILLKVNTELKRLEQKQMQIKADADADTEAEQLG